MSTLRGKQPDERKTRLKLLLSGSAGVGKTMAAIQMPKPYIIDTERGSIHYGKHVKASSGSVWEATDVTEIIKEVRALITTKHDFLTLVIDPITNVYDMAVAEGEQKLGIAHGRHYGYANNLFKRLCALLTVIDMNVILTAHEKKQFATQTNADGEKESVEIGTTFDGYKKLDYMFDLYLTLEREADRVKDSPRLATVQKTRIEAFPDQDRFVWTYDELVKRFGRDKLEKGVETLDLATPPQVERFTELLAAMTNEDIERLKIHKAIQNYPDFADMPTAKIAKGIELLEKNQPQAPKSY